jgi:NitT/TauT family transport system permease protein
MNGRARQLAEIVVPPLLLFVVVIALWETVVIVAHVPKYILPRPSQVWAAAIANRDELLQATQLTAEAAMAGFGLSLIVGSLVAMLFSQSKLVTRAFYPYAIFLQTVPIVAIAPIIIIWFGFGLQSVVLVAFIISLFPIIAGGASGMTLVDPNLLELFTLYNASRLQTLLKLRLPHAAPYLVTAAKTSSGLAVVGAIVGEIYAGYGTTSQALGYLITQTNGMQQTDLLFATVACATLLGLAMFASVSAVGALALRRWHSAGRREA